MLVGSHLPDFFFLPPSLLLLLSDREYSKANNSNGNLFLIWMRRPDSCNWRDGHGTKLWKIKKALAYSRGIDSGYAVHNEKGTRKGN